MLGKKTRLTRRIAVLFMVALLQPVAGCTLLENLRSQQKIDPMESDRTAEIVEMRAAELTGLEDMAEVKAPGDLGRARAVLDEMVYFRDEGDAGQVMRLDGVMSGTLESMRQAIDAQGEDPTERVSRLEDQNQVLQSRISSLESRVAGLQVRKEVLEFENNTLNTRLKAALKSRDDAVREVVRTRSRIEGMASQAEAAAMFAEARVLVDRMVDDAYNDRALGELEQARTYLDSGKKELEEGNSGGAAYLFDLVSSLYEGFKDADPRKVTVSVSNCYLRSTPSTSSKRTGGLSQGDVVTGLEMNRNWIRVVTASGQKGWILKNQVH